MSMLSMSTSHANDKNSTTFTLSKCGMQIGKAFMEVLGAYSRIVLELIVVVSVAGAVRKPDYVSASPIYVDYTLSDEDTRTVDYDDEHSDNVGINKWEPINTKKIREGDEEVDTFDIENIYKAESRLRSPEIYRYPHYHSKDTIQIHRLTTATEQWDDDIEVEIKDRRFTKKNKVAKTGTRSEFEKLHYAYKRTTNKHRQKSSLKFIGHINLDSDGSKNEPIFPYEKRRGSAEEENNEDNNESPLRWKSKAGLLDEHDYDDLKRLNKIKLNLSPLIKKTTNEIAMTMTDKAISSTSVAERELQAYLNGHRLRKAAGPWSSTADNLILRTTPGTRAQLFTDTPSISPNSSLAASLRPPRLSAAHHPRNAQGLDVIAGSGNFKAEDGYMANNYTFTPLAVDPVFEALWNSFIAKKENGAQMLMQSAKLLYMLCLVVIIYYLQRYG